VNQAFLNTYGYSSEEVLGRTPHFLYAKENPAGLCDEIHRQTMQGGWRGELFNQTKEGRIIPIALSTSLIKTRDGAGVGMAGFARDVTERKRLEHQMREAEADYRGIFENATEGIFRSTPDGRCLRANPALARMFGYNSTEEVISEISDLRHQHYVSPEK